MIFVNRDVVPGLVEPTGLTIDINRLTQEIDALQSTYGFDGKSMEHTVHGQKTFNLNHPEKLPSDIKTTKELFVSALCRGENELQRLFNLSTKDFTQFNEAVTKGYLWEVICAVTDWHNANNSSLGKISRIHCAYLGPGAGFQLHKDLHTTLRYHIALATNKFCTMVTVSDLDSNEAYTTHIPADGKVWRLGTQVLHTALNLVPEYSAVRNKVRGHVIFSVT